MTDDPLRGLSEVDTTVLDAVAAMDRGDLRELQTLLSANPGLVRDRIECGEGYFSRPYLLWFVAGNPIRVDRLPTNAAAVAEMIIREARSSEVKTLKEQVDYTLSLVCSGRAPRDSGVQTELIDALVDAGADPTGALDPALAHREVGAVEHLLEVGARITLATAAALGRIEDLRELMERATPEERRSAMATAAIWNRGESIRALAEGGAGVSAYNPEGFHGHATPLHSAVASRSLQAVEALIELGADPSMKDRLWNGTPLEWADHVGAVEIARLLREARRK